MSENPNPTVCGNCGTENPPGREFCVQCGSPLTLSADPAALGGTPEAPDELRRLEGGEEPLAGSVIVGSMGAAPIVMPAEPQDPDPDKLRQ